MRNLILFLVALVCVTAHAQFKPTPYDTNNDATARAFVASQIGAQVAGSNYLNAQQVGAQIGGSNYTTSAQIAGSNFLNAAQVGTQIGGSNYWTIASTNLFTGTNGLVGTTTNNPIQAGLVGEYTNKVIGFGSRVSLTSNVTATVTSFVLTPGDWDVEGLVTFTDIGSTIISSPNAGISPQVAVISAAGDSVFSGVLVGVGADSLTIPRTRVYTPTNCTVFLLANLTFTGGTPGAYGTMSARRVR